MRASTNDSASFPAVYVKAAPAPFDIEDASWGTTRSFEGFETITTQSPARYATSAKLAFDETNLYVVINCDQAGLPIIATEHTNNVGFGLDDFAGVGIDTSTNGSDVYYFETTPNGIRYQSSRESSRFDPPWHALAKKTKSGWVASLSIPLAVFRSAPKKSQRWRFNLVRHIAALNENMSFAYDPLMADNGNFLWPSFGDAKYWPSLDGILITNRNGRPKPREEVYVLGSAGDDRHVYQQASGLFETTSPRYAGADVNIPITGTTAFVGALAPDFSNVEIDQQTISPQEFRRALTEYRPFFAQGAKNFAPLYVNGINGAPNVIYYTPNFGSIDRGEKIEGTQGLDTFGILNVEGDGFDDTAIGFSHILPKKVWGYGLDIVDAHHADNNDTALPTPANDISFDATATGRSYNTGIIYGLEYAGEHNSTNPLTNPNLAYKSEDFLDLKKRNFEVFVQYRDIGPKWNPVDGFTQINDIRGPGSYFYVFGDPKGGIFKRVQALLFGDRLTDGSGKVRQSDASLSVDLLLRNQLHLSGGPSTSSLRLYDNGENPDGFSSKYLDGITVPFNDHSINLGYRDGSASPIDASYSFGPFETSFPNGVSRPTFLQQADFSTQRPLARQFSATLEYAETIERNAVSETDGQRECDGQQLRRIGLGKSLGADSNVSVSLLEISGKGGFAEPGVNLAAAYHYRFHNDSELFLNYGSPAANQTLQRFTLKYLLRFGSGSGI